MQKSAAQNQGFTLIELAIVLVIIGLIAGGVLVGQDLIRAATVRAQISQIEKYQTAVNTFRGKYGYLPGDIPNPYATQFGFQPRGIQPGQGDGNGLIQSYSSGSMQNQNGDPALCNSNLIGTNALVGESSLFWADLTSAKLIDQTFVMPQAYEQEIGTIGVNDQISLDASIPQAKLGNGNYVFVWSGGWQGSDGINYFGLSAVTQNDICYVDSTINIPVIQAYNIDKKIDDGFPQSGNVMAMVPTNGVWAAGAGNSGADSVSGGPTNAATPGSPTTCYDNNNVSGPQKYSVTQNNGAGANCALSFRFQ